MGRTAKTRSKAYSREKKRAQRARDKLYRTNDFATLMIQGVRVNLTRNNVSANSPLRVPEALRAIMHMQNGYCIFIDRLFVLPTEYEAAMFHSWDAWRKTLAARLQLYTPELVMCEPESGWVLGNVMFIGAGLADAFNMIGGLRRWKAMCGRVIDSGVGPVSPYDLIPLIDKLKAHEAHKVAERKLAGKNKSKS